MALFTKADFIGTYAIDTAAKRDFILRYSNNKGHQHFESMAVASGAVASPAQPPLTLADMLQSYVLDTAAKVEQVLQNSPNGASGLRGHEFLTACKLIGITPGGTIDKAAGTVSDPAQVTFNGIFFAGQTVTIACTANPGAVAVNVAIPVNSTQTPQQFAATATAYIQQNVPELSAGGPGGADGSTILIAPASPYTDVTVNTVSVA